MQEPTKNRHIDKEIVARVIGKEMATRFAEILGVDYQAFL